MKKEPFVVIAIINYNRRKETDQCLTSLEITNYKNYKVFLLDNGSSTDDYNYFKKKYKNITVFKSHTNIGASAGRNLLFIEIFDRYNPYYICTMDNDIITIDKDWLKKMVNTLEKKEEYGICGNKLISPDTLPSSYIRKDTNHTLKEEQCNFEKEVPSVITANMLIKKSVIKKIGGFDENLFYGPEDIDYCYRAKKAGFKIIYNDFSKSIHAHNYTYLQSTEDFIYKHQSHAMLVFSFRYDPLYKKINMSLRELIRAVVTRKKPYNKITINNLYFHKTFIKRTIYFFESFTKALKNYKTVKGGEKLYETKYWLR
jgi:GT2 family glycosyltransferase